ncbi:MAG: hypothetical protein K6E13_01780 [Lachnospiraceae bacterium]|nr:hypothetical protein [Lachnospiraceae bacterium]
MDKEQLIQKRFIDLSNTADKKGIVTFSDFLDLNEQNLFNNVKNQLYTDYKIFGGYEHAERQLIAFIPDALYYAWNYPIDCIVVEPVSKKFKEKLTHRDILGALMSLGVERSKIGDILPGADETYILCLDTLSSFICESLTQVRHTTVNTTIKTIDSFDYSPNLVDKEGVVASERLDCVIAFAFNIKRSEAVSLIQGGNVFVNAKNITSNAYFCKPDDILSVRGHGKLRFNNVLNETKKGRSRISVSIYS